MLSGDKAEERYSAGQLQRCGHPKDRMCICSSRGQVLCKPVQVVSERAGSSRPNASTTLVADRPSAVPSLPGLMLFVFLFHLLHFVLRALLNVTAGQGSPCWRSAMVMCCAI